jgi:hypothetical protein
MAIVKNFSFLKEVGKEFGITAFFHVTKYLMAILLANIFGYIAFYLGNRLYKRYKRRFVNFVKVKYHELKALVLNYFYP